jgi:hypothetical protein
MDVRGGYDGLQYRYTTEDFNDPDACEWVDIDPAAFIHHAANMHIFRNSELSLGLPTRRLWSLPNACPSGRARTLSPDLK